MTTKTCLAVAAGLFLFSNVALAGDEDVRVHVDHGTLFHQSEAVCSAPCDVIVPRGKYVLIADDFESKPFSIVAPSSVVSVAQRRKSYTVPAAIIMGASLAVASVFAVAAIATANETCTGFLCFDTSAMLAVTSGIFAGGGLITGGILLALPTKTVNDVHVDTHAAKQVVGNLTLRF